MWLTIIDEERIIFIIICERVQCIILDKSVVPRHSYFNDKIISVLHLRRSRLYSYVHIHLSCRLTYTDFFFLIFDIYYKYFAPSLSFIKRSVYVSFFFPFFFCNSSTVHRRQISLSYNCHTYSTYIYIFIKFSWKLIFKTLFTEIYRHFETESLHKPSYGKHSLALEMRKNSHIYPFCTFVSQLICKLTQLILLSTTFANQLIDHSLHSHGTYCYMMFLTIRVTYNQEQIMLTI